jgi:hypothetical protein
LYEIQQQQQIKLLQKFPKKHSYVISCLLHLNPNTLVSACSMSFCSYNVIVIWSKSKSSSLYEPIQRIIYEEAGGDIYKLVLINQKKEEEEEIFASCSHSDDSIIIWRRREGEGEFQINQKITNVKGFRTLIYISLTNELISGSWSRPSLLQIWSPLSSSSYFAETQKLKTTTSGIVSLCEINRNDSNRIEFASGHTKGQIMIWSKQINESKYSLSKTLKPFNGDSHVNDLICINDNEFNHFLIGCSWNENKIVIYKGEGFEEEKELEHEQVTSLIKMSNGQFASGGGNKCLKIWSPSSFSSSSSSIVKTIDAIY